MYKKEKLEWKVKHNLPFLEEEDFLTTILKSNGVQDVQGFLYPNSSFEHDAFDLLNMKKAVQLLHEAISQNKKVFIKVDCDADGFTSAATLYQFIKTISPDTPIECRLNFEKKHGLVFEDVAHLINEEMGIFVIPDASILVSEINRIRERFPEVPILILDHHKIEDSNKQMLEMTTAVNCTLGDYPNPHLSGAGVVYKFCVAYCETYNIDRAVADRYLDLVTIGIIADAMSLLDLENRYYISLGIEEENRHCDFLKELIALNADDFKFGLTYTNIGWVVGPRINAVVRYGKPEEQIQLFRAMCGEKEDIEYQPRRKKASDPKPPIEIHSLQKTAARICNTVKNRQDTEVRNFVKKLDAKIVEEGLSENSIIAVDGTDILTKSTVTGLIANKIASKYRRPCLVFKSENKDTFGGSARNYGQGNLDNLMGFLQQFNLFEKTAGHNEAFGIGIKKDKVPELIERINEKLPLSSLKTIHEVDYEIDAATLKKNSVQGVAANYKVWGNDIPEPTFAITNLHIDAKDIKAYGENQGFIRFVYKGIPFIKKYCPRGEYDQMVLTPTKGVGNNKKLTLNLICSFVLNEYEGNITPQVKILEFDSQERTEEQIEEEWIF